MKLEDILRKAFETPSDIRRKSWESARFLKTKEKIISGNLDFNKTLAFLDENGKLAAVYYVTFADIFADDWEFVSNEITKEQYIDNAIDTACDRLVEFVNDADETPEAKAAYRRSIEYLKTLKSTQQAGPNVE